MEGGAVLDEGLGLVERARAAGLSLRLVGGLAVRVLCPDYPPRVRTGQDLDLATSSKSRPDLTRLLEEAGYEPDRRFNALYGHKQLYFASPTGRPVDVLVDRLEMCHVLEFRDRIDRMPLTLDVTDLLLSKLQIVELNEKDAQDAIYLLAGFAVREGDDPGTIGTGRFAAIVADDWGWWRTITMNLERIRGLAEGGGPPPVPPNARFDVPEQVRALAEAATAVPKSLRWRLRARVGDRKRWYRVPQEEAHD